MKTAENKDQSMKKTEPEDRKNTVDTYEPPKGASTEQILQTGGSDGGEKTAYTAAADWLILRKEQKPRAEMFFVSYNRKTDEPRRRPITFVFNGGPGASSVYLHLGAMGPKKAPFSPDGYTPAPPYRLCDNEETWLHFTDLVFIDPVGTGFSRMIVQDESGKSDKESSREGDKESSEYWKLKRDLESLGEFIRSYLSLHHRWESPIYIAGESYGGFRTAKLTRLLQKEYGVGLSGAVIISPALEFSLLDGTDYNVLTWIDTFPTMAAAAGIHGKSRKKTKSRKKENGRVNEQGEMQDPGGANELLAYMKLAGTFAVEQLLPVLAAGDLLGDERRRQVLNQAADFIGLPRPVVAAKNGRVEIDYFVKNLLRDEGKLLGLYDISLTVTDPYPDREAWSGPDPTLDQSERVFAAGINTQLRKNIGLETDRDYELLSLQVNKKWENDARKHALDSEVGATDDLRFGMSLNPDMKVFLTHGLFDLVTPFFSAERITHLMKLTDEQKKQLHVRFYPGGHMFYLREESRRQFARDLRAWYEG
jgi:carboxypeptidase C (cathepsin A)